MTVIIEETPSPTEEPTPFPTDDPTSSPVTAAPTPCVDRLFYIFTDTEGVTKCSNGYDLVTTTPETYATAKECCAGLVAVESGIDGGKCEIIDVCIPSVLPTPSPTPEPTPSPTLEPSLTITAMETTPSPATPAPTSCKDLKFYVIEGSGGTDKKCSNEIGGAITGTTMYESIKECCTTFCGDNDTCNFIDICNPTTPVPTVAPTIAITEDVKTLAPVTAEPATSIPTML